MIVLDAAAGLWMLAVLFMSLMELTSAVIAPGPRRWQHMTEAMVSLLLSLPALAYLVWRHP